MEPDNLLMLFTTAFGLVPETIVLVACLVYLRKRSGADSVVMTVGALLSMLISIAWMPLNTLFMASSREEAETFFRMLAYASTGASLIFTAGLFMLVLKHISPRPVR